MRIVTDKDGDAYNEARTISNARFNYYPRAIYYCERVEDVQTAVNEMRDNGWKFRIRSGGHHHEGMCSGNGMRIIDVSSINDFDYDHDQEHVWVGAGASLKAIYADLWIRGYLFPGGGCPDVHVGGLAQGGGWGPQSRAYGLTCDNLLGVEIVTADGRKNTITEQGDADDRLLLKALRGGGGGNFGVVTKYCFRLRRFTQPYTDIALKWGDDQLPGDALDDFVYHWVSKFPRHADTNLTTFLRVSVVNDPAKGDRAVVGGRYLGSIDDAKRTMRELLRGQPPPRDENYTPAPPPHWPRATATEGLNARSRMLLGERLARLPEYQPAPIADLADTCGGVPLRHKISSGFADKRFNLAAVRSLTKRIRGTDTEPGIRKYVSFHCLGGAVGDEPYPSSFAFRDRGFLLQYQAWWFPHEPEISSECIGWIAGWRRTMRNYTTGAFINFPDRHLALADYYGDKLDDLIMAKTIWDEFNFFQFDMSIPRKRRAPQKTARRRA